MSEEATRHDADRRQRTAERAAEALYAAMPPRSSSA